MNDLLTYLSANPSEVFVSLVALITVLAVALATRQRRTLATTPLEPTVKLSTLQAASKTKHCATCVHWDLEEGQAVIRANPAFHTASQWVTPQRMSVKFDEEGNPSDASVQARVAWKDFGACLFHQEGRWKEDSCDQFSPKV